MAWAKGPVNTSLGRLRAYPGGDVRRAAASFRFTSLSKSRGFISPPSVLANPKIQPLFAKLDEATENAPSFRRRRFCGLPKAFHVRQPSCDSTVVQYTIQQRRSSAYHLSVSFLHCSSFMPLITAATISPPIRSLPASDNRCLLRILHFPLVPIVTGVPVCNSIFRIGGANLVIKK